MRHTFLLFLLILGAPFWLGARRKHGKRFFQTLLLAVAVIGTIAFAVDEKLIPLPDSVAPYAHSKLAQWFFISSYMGFVLQLIMRFFDDPETNPRSGERPHSWSTGHFHIWQGWPVLTDLLIVGWVLFIVYGGNFGPAHDPVSMIITGVSSAAFFIVACVGYLNHGTLPFTSDPARPKKAPKPQKPILTHLRRMPKAASEDLGAIFSRRHPALQKITATD